MHIPSRSVGVGLLSLWLSATALAQQVIEARDGVAVEAILSRREPTRIRIEGAPITDVFGSIYSSTCSPPASAPAIPSMAEPPALALNPAGEIILECDRSKGEIYLRPVADSNKPVNLFVASAQATYTLILRPVDTPADTIVIRDSAQTAPAGRSTGRATRHVQALKHLLSALATAQLPPGYQRVDVDRPLALWREARVTLQHRYEGRELIGEHYQLHNLSAAELVLAEQEFDRAGDAVLAVAIEQHTLAPGGSSAVYVIRRAEVQP